MNTGFQLGLGALLKAPEVIRDWYGTVNDIRNDVNSRDALNAISRFSSSREARDFDPAAAGYLRPDSLMKINDLRADKMDSLLRREAAPVQAEASNLLNMARTDPFVGSEEGRRDFAERPEFWLSRDVPRTETVSLGVDAQGNPLSALRTQFSSAGAVNSGAVTGAKGTTPESGGNPYESQALQQFARENSNVLNAFRAGGGDRMAGANVAVDKDLAAGFDNSAQGMERFAKERTAEAARVADQRLAKYYADTPYDPRQHAAWMEGAARTGAPTDEVLKLSQHLMDRNKGIVAEYRDVTVNNGPNSTVERVGFNAYGQPVTGLSTQSTNNPSDRELGITGGGGPTVDDKLDVSWVANGIANAARIPRSELPTLKAELTAQGVTELSTVDGKRASRTERLIKETSQSKRDKHRPKGTAATPAPAATGGGYTYVNGKLVKN